MCALGCYFVTRGNNQRSRSNVFALVIVSHYAYLLMPDVAKHIATNVYYLLYIIYIICVYIIYHISFCRLYIHVIYIYGISCTAPLGDFLVRNDDPIENWESDLATSKWYYTCMFSFSLACFPSCGVSVVMNSMWIWSTGCRSLATCSCSLPQG